MTYRGHASGALLSNPRRQVVSLDSATPHASAFGSQAPAGKVIGYRELFWVSECCPTGCACVAQHGLGGRGSL
jgi:hypothetical protein